MSRASAVCRGFALRGTTMRGLNDIVLLISRCRAIAPMSDPQDLRSGTVTHPANGAPAHAPLWSGQRYAHLCLRSAIRAPQTVRGSLGLAAYWPACASGWVDLQWPRTGGAWNAVRGF